MLMCADVGYTSIYKHIGSCFIWERIELNRRETCCANYQPLRNLYCTSRRHLRLLNALPPVRSPARRDFSCTWLGQLMRTCFTVTLAWACNSLDIIIDANRRLYKYLIYYSQLWALQQSMQRILKLMGFHSMGSRFTWHDTLPSNTQRSWT